MKEPKNDKFNQTNKKKENLIKDKQSARMINK
jgi:hypothetical protein